MAADFEYIGERGIARIHYGKLSPEELQKTVEKAARDFYQAIYPDLVRLGKLDQYTRPVSTNEVR